MSPQNIGTGKIPVSHVFMVCCLGVLLLVASITVHSIEKFDIYRFLRGFVSLSFLGLSLVLRKNRINPYVILFLSVYGISSLLTIWYEDARFAIASLGLNIVAFAVLVIGLIPKVSFRNIGVWLTVIFSILVLVNVYLLYEFIVMLKNFAQGNIHYVFMLMGAMSMVIAGLFALLFNHVNTSKASLYFTISVFSIIFAEIFRAIAYYDFGYGNVSVYGARLLLIVGTICLVIYSLLSKSSKEELGRNRIY